MSFVKKEDNNSPEFWKVIESIYGEVPKLIKLILQLNGFSTFFSLKGLRYDNKNEFFGSLEETVSEILSYGGDSNEFLELSHEITANHQRIENFKIRPGHRNLILNLLSEVEKTDFTDLINQCQFSQETSSSNNVHESVKNEEQIDSQQDFMYVMSNDEDQQTDQTGQDNDIYMTEEDVIVEDDPLIEEEYLVEQDDGITEEEFVEVEIDHARRKRSHALGEYISATGRTQKKYKPEHMYNEEFLNSNVSRRKKTYNKKQYENTDEGIKQRFIDMLGQSLEIILTKDVYERCKDIELEVQKVKENSWTARCPICHYIIKLPIVAENGGKYKNYKRSNFERHIRFKHCPGGRHYESPNTYGFQM